MDESAGGVGRGSLPATESGGVLTGGRPVTVAVGLRSVVTGRGFPCRSTPHAPAAVSPGTGRAPRRASFMAPRGGCGRVSPGRASGWGRGGGAWGRGRRGPRCGARRPARRDPAATGTRLAWARLRACVPVGGVLVGQGGDRRPRCGRRSGGSPRPRSGAAGAPKVMRGRRRRGDRAALAQDAARCPRRGSARPARRSAATGRPRRRGTAGPSRRGCDRPRGRSACSSRRRCSSAASSADLRPTLVRSIGMAPMHRAPTAAR